MKRSWKIGQPFGVDTEVHASFLLLLAWVIVGALSGGGGAASAAYSTVFLIGMFASVVLHELGHALAARAFGIRTRRILLLPIGGMAQLERMPKAPRAEMIIALAGPAVSLALAGIFSLASTLLAGVPGVAGSTLMLFVGSLMWANLMLAVFNMAPAFPMDGGRALRAFLASRMSHLRATEVAVAVGKTAAVALAVAAIAWNPWLLLIAGFVWFAGNTELRALRRQQRFTGAPNDTAVFWDSRPRRTKRPADPFNLAMSPLGTPRVRILHWRASPRGPR